MNFLKCLSLLEVHMYHTYIYICRLGQTVSNVTDDTNEDTGDFSNFLIVLLCVFSKLVVNLS